MTSIALSNASVSKVPTSLPTWPTWPTSSAPIISAIPLIEAKKTADAERLFELKQLEVTWDASLGVLSAFMRPRGRPSYNLELLDDIHALQRGIVAKFAGRSNELRYLLAGSRTPGVFSLGGDLDLFAACISIS